MFDQEPEQPAPGLTPQTPGVEQGTEMPQQRAGRGFFTPLSCGIIGCVTLVILIVIAIAGGSWYLLRKRPIPPAEAFMPKGWPCLVIIEVEAEDEHVLALLAEAGGADLGGPNAPDMDDIGMFLPVRAVLALKAGGPEEETHVQVAASVGGASGLLRLMFKAMSAGPAAEGQVERHKGINILKSDDFWLALFDTNVLAGPDIEAIKDGIDRAAQPAAELAYQGPEELAEIYAALDPEATCRFLCTNSEGELETLIAERGEQWPFEMFARLPVPWSDVAAMGAEASMPAYNTMAVKMILSGRSEEAAERVRAALEQAQAGMDEDMGYEDVKVGRSGSRVDLEFTKAGVVQDMDNSAVPLELGAPGD